MAGIDASREFIPLKIAVLTVSDTRNLADDKSGATLADEEVRSYCRDRIAHYKVPRYVVFVEEYPTTVTGKIQKFKLRELGIERFGLEQAARVETA